MVLAMERGNCRDEVDDDDDRWDMSLWLATYRKTIPCTHYNHAYQVKCPARQFSPEPSEDGVGRAGDRVLGTYVHSKYLLYHHLGISLHS